MVDAVEEVEEVLRQQHRLNLGNDRLSKIYDTARMSLLKSWFMYITV